MATLLQIVQRFCQRTNLAQPATVIGNTDPQVVQIKALLEEIGIDANSRGTWQRTTFQQLHTTLALEDQGDIATIAGAGWDYVKNMTIWDRTQRLPVLGPLTGVQWQTLQAMTIIGPQYQFRLLNNRLLVNPAPPAGHTWAFEYGSKYWILGADLTTYKEYFTLDTDTPVIPDNVLIQGLRWRWKAEKGLSYEEDFAMYETQLADASNRDGGKPVLHMDGGGRGLQPGIWVSPNSWPL